MENGIEQNLKNVQNHLRNPLSRMFSRARAASKKNGWYFNLNINDLQIPSFCPVLGIPLFIENNKRRDNSPSLDRIDNTKGYVIGNVLIVSYRANRLKSDSNKSEREKIFLFYKDLL